EESPHCRTPDVGDESRHRGQASAEGEPDEVLAHPGLADGVEMESRPHATPRRIIQSANVTASQAGQHSAAPLQTGRRCHRTPHTHAALYAARPTAPSAIDCACVAA